MKPFLKSPYLSIGWFLKRFHLAFLEPSWFPRKKKILLWIAKTKGYLWPSFHDIQPSSKSPKLDIQMAISAKQIMIWKIFLCKRKHNIGVVLVPNFHLSASSSSFFLAFFFTFMENLFKKHPIYSKAMASLRNVFALYSSTSIQCSLVITSQRTNPNLISFFFSLFL